jgi:hypothetical protein
MEKTAVEFIFDAVYRDIPFSELLGIIAQAKVMEKQQDKKMYSEEEVKNFMSWIDEEEIPREDGFWIRYFNGKDNYLTTKELYEQFKKKLNN